jgi:hypothetical protein
VVLHFCSALQGSWRQQAIEFECTQERSSHVFSARINRVQVVDSCSRAKFALRIHTSPRGKRRVSMKCEGHLAGSQANTRCYIRSLDEDYLCSACAPLCDAATATSSTVRSRQTIDRAEVSILSERREVEKVREPGTDNSPTTEIHHWGKT